MSERYAETRCGFDWGAASITRITSLKDTVILGLRTPRESLEFWITPTGFVRIKDVKRKSLFCKVEKGFIQDQI